MLNRKSDDSHSVSRHTPGFRGHSEMSELTAVWSVRCLALAEVYPEYRLIPMVKVSKLGIQALIARNTGQVWEALCLSNGRKLEPRLYGT
jgi:hypothetical protein